MDLMKRIKRSNSFALLTRDDVLIFLDVPFICYHRKCLRTRCWVSYNKNELSNRIANFIYLIFCLVSNWALISIK